MNEGVKILLERMKTNPEEFVDSSKWAGLIHGYKAYLSKEDAQALEDAYNGLMQEQFTSKVMKELLAPEEDDSLGKPWYTQQGNITLSAGTTLGGVTLSSGAGTGTWGTSSISLAEAQHQSTVAHMKAHLQALQAGTSTKHQTLFGKLKNYLHNE